MERLKELEDKTKDIEGNALEITQELGQKDGSSSHLHDFYTKCILDSEVAEGLRVTSDISTGKTVGQGGYTHKNPANIDPDVDQLDLDGDEDFNAEKEANQFFKNNPGGADGTLMMGGNLTVEMDAMKVVAGSDQTVGGVDDTAGDVLQMLNRKPMLDPSMKKTDEQIKELQELALAASTKNSASKKPQSNGAIEQRTSPSPQENQPKGRSALDMVDADAE